MVMLSGQKAYTPGEVNVMHGWGKNRVYGYMKTGVLRYIEFGKNTRLITERHLGEFYSRREVKDKKSYLKDTRDVHREKAVAV